MSFHLPSLHTSGKIAKLTFSFLPRKCEISNKSIWFKTAYKIVEHYYDLQQPDKVFVTYTWWLDKHEYIIDRLNS